MRQGVLIAVVMASSLTFAACGGNDGEAGDGGGSSATPGAEVELTAMSFDQWKAVELETSKDEIIEQFGEPAFGHEGTYTETLSYMVDTPNVLVSFTFDPDNKALESKVWSESRSIGAKISNADYERVKHGMTEQEVIDLIGEPWEIENQVASYRLHDGANPAGTLQHCLLYTPPGNLANATICFDPAGKVNWKISTRNGKVVSGPE